MNISGNIPYVLAKIVDGLMSEWKVLQVLDEIDWKHSVSPEATWVPGG